MDNHTPRWPLSHETLQSLGDISAVKRQLAAGKQVSDLLLLESGQLGELYHTAYRLFQQQRYEEARYAFLFLAFLDGNNYDFWLGLGMALQMCHYYEAAIDAYELAAICDVENPVAYFYLGKCLFAIHDHGSAMDALEMAITYASDREEYHELLKQAQVARDSLVRRQ